MKRFRFRTWPIVAFCAAALLAIARSTLAEADEYRDPCDGEQTTWSVGDINGARQRGHGRNTKVFHEGTASEEFAFDAGAESSSVLLEHPLSPPGRVVPELKASVWVRSNRPGARVRLRIVFPHQKDPKTGKTLTTLIGGSEYSETNHWQQLACETSEKATQKEARLLRLKLQPYDVDLRESFVSAVVVTSPLHAGGTQIFLDDLQVGPLTGLEPSLAERATEQPVVRPSVEMRQGELEVGDQPRLTIMLIHHGEKLSTLKDMHANTVLVRGVDDQALLTALGEQGLRVAAQPPLEGAPAGGARAAAAYDWPEVAMWYLGTLISSGEREQVVSRVEQLRRRDFRRRRPALADVAEDERYFSRYVSILGTSRHVAGTAFSFKDYQRWLLERSRLANPGTYLFTWIQTEPILAERQRRQGEASAVVIEPEQIRLALYAAISAGYRGFGYWSWGSLEGDAPGALERRLVLTQLDLEIEFIEPLLARAARSDSAPVRIVDPAPKMRRHDLDFPHDASQRDREIRQKLSERDIQQKNLKLTASETEATVFQGSNYKLIVVTWLAHDAQCVPGRLAGNDVKVLIPEPSETARFWQVTTTGIRELKKEKTTGFYQVTLPKFDQTAVILDSWDPGWAKQVDARAREFAPLSARVSLELARAKCDRVRAVDAELTEAEPGARQDDAPQFFAAAERYLQRAQAALSQQSFHEAREAANDAMQLVRSLQYVHWNHAVTQSVSLPIVSPYTVCFQTLPDHWRLVRRIGRSADRPQENLLPSGNFEDEREVLSQWVQTQANVEGVGGRAELYPSAHGGKRSLRLLAGPVAGTDPPTVILKTPVTVVSPAVPVRAGQVLVISGWIKMVTRVTGSLDGVTIHDSLGDTAGALRFTDKNGWQRFQMLRDVRRDGEEAVTVKLHGMGDVLVDDLQIIPHVERRIRMADRTREMNPGPPRAFNLRPHARPREIEVRPTSAP